MEMKNFEALYMEFKTKILEGAMLKERRRAYLKNTNKNKNNPSIKLSWARVLGPWCAVNF